MLIVKQGLSEAGHQYFTFITKEGCDLAHVRHWLDLFTDMHYARRRRIVRFRNLMGFLTGGDVAQVYRALIFLRMNKYPIVQPIK
jgi:hypothetical protein